MFGDVKSEVNEGLVSRSCRMVLDFCKKQEGEGVTCVIKAAMIEIYNEQINDLLNKDGKNLQLREDAQQGVYIPNLKELDIKSVNDLIKCVDKGFASRATSSTKMNDQSSRSHCLVQIRMTQTKEDGNFKKDSKLNLVDLAGSEKVKKTGAKGAALKEAQKINTSLSALGKIIRLLSDKQMKEQAKGKGEAEGGGESKSNKRNRRKGSQDSDKPIHIPYRDSKLTRILQNSLGGNTKTMLLVACSPHDDNYEETISTLRFASRARMISNITSVNATTTNLEGFKATGTTAPELREQIKVCVCLLCCRCGCPAVWKTLLTRLSFHLPAIENIRRVCAKTLPFQGLDAADKEVAKSKADASTASFDPTNSKAKERIYELRGIVEKAVGCAFEENLFNNGVASKDGGGKESRPRSPRAPGAAGGGGNRRGRGGRGKRGRGKRGGRRR